MPNIVNEGSSASFTVAFLDADGVATVPNAVRYRIDCMTTGAEIAAWASLTPGTTVSVPLTAALNVMQSEANTRETRRVTVEASYSSDGKLVDFEDFTLANSMGV
jgi:hypothetical protein